MLRSAFFLAISTLPYLTAARLTMHNTIEIPEGYSNQYMEPAVFGDLPAENIHLQYRSRTPVSERPPDIKDVYKFASLLGEDNLEKVRHRARERFNGLSDEAKKTVSVNALTMELLAGLMHQTENRRRIEKPAVTNDDKAKKPRRIDVKSTEKPNAASKIKRVVRKKESVGNPLDLLKIEGLGEQPTEPGVGLVLVSHDLANPDEQIEQVAAFHWVQLVYDENEQVRHIIAIRDKRLKRPFSPPEIPYNDAMTATLQIHEGPHVEEFGVLTGTFNFEFGVFDFYQFFVVN